jgi:glutathione S-transferase
MRHAIRRSAGVVHRVLCWGSGWEGTMSELVLIGRSSSHYSRIVRILARELDVAHEFQPVFDITSMDSAVYGENPALKVPVLVDERGPLFGTENICRELVRRSARGARVVLRGDVRERVVANVEELTLHVMTSEVSLIMAKMSGDATPASPKVTRSIEGSLAYLDDRVDAALDALPNDRLVSFVEISLFCLLTHLPFRKVLDVTAWTRLSGFVSVFGKRESAQTTEYKFDTP